MPTKNNLYGVLVKRAQHVQYLMYILHSNLKAMMDKT